MEPRLDRRLAELRDVGAGDERASRADDDDRLDRAVSDGLLDPIVEPLADVLGERVDGRVVDGQHGHGAAGAEVYGLSDLRHVQLLSESKVAPMILGNDAAGSAA